MTDILNYEKIENKIICLRGQKVIVDSEVADLYGVETREINQAVNRNTDKFPSGYIMELDESEWGALKSQFVTSMKGGKIKLPKAFTEKGLYMLATILKGPKATETTLKIIETFAKVREVEGIVSQLPALKESNPEHQKLLHRAGEIISDLVVPSSLEKDQTEATIELNFAVVKFKYSVKKKAK